MKLPFSLTTLGLFIGFCIHAQNIRIYHEKTAEGYEIFADNPELYPVSVAFEFTLTNLMFSDDESRVFVIPAKSIKNIIGTLTRNDTRAGTKMSYKYKYIMGDVTLKIYDKDYVYDLPFKTGKSFKLYQGYNGTFSHANENALDFTMPEGTEVLAAREGTVVNIVQSNSASCPSKECEKFNNYVTILHADGTFANYLHIKYNGANCKPGDQVKKGDIIAYSGNVGWSSGPHLHFVCFLPAFGKNLSVETKFRIKSGDEAQILQQGQTYSREY